MKQESIYPAILLTGLLTASASTVDAETKQSRKNIMLIIVDDLRPELNCYGRTEIRSPHIDALAESGVRFSRAYCNIAVSGASRSCIMTGTRPTRNTFLVADTHACEEKPDKTAMNDFFRSVGYFTIASSGKIFHHPDDHQEGWDILRPRFQSMKYLSPENLVPRTDGRRGRPYECLDVEDNRYIDGKIADQAIEDLKMLAKSDKPFFYGLGFFKPHLPFTAPKKYWDLYDYDEIEVPDNYVLKEGHDIPAVALPQWGELRNKYVGLPERRGEPVPIDTARKLIQGYRACVSFTDAQIGRVLAEFRRLGLDKNTIIVLIGDHGWNLGEHGAWCKHSILHTSLHTPMIIVDPSARLKNHVCDEVVEFVDLFPTLCDLAGVEPPEQLEGRSLRPLLNDPEARSKGYAVARWMQGYTLVTDDGYFYTEWWDDEDRITERLLFDHNIDPDENYNVAAKSEYALKVNELSTLLKQRRGAEFDKYSGK